MRRLFPPLVLSILFALAAGSCSSSERVLEKKETREKEAGPPPKAPLSVYEPSFNPADYDEEGALVKKRRGDTLETEAAKDSVVVEEEQVQGFRIQIFVSSSIDEANAMKMTAAQKFPEDSVYVVFDPPVYKVRVGDYTTRVVANQKLPSVANEGFPDAWVVSDRIIQRRFIRVRPSDAPGREDEY